MILPLLWLRGEYKIRPYRIQDVYTLRVIPPITPPVEAILVIALQNLMTIQGLMVEMP